ncbi:putative transcriptional regulatory protein [Colletotrichum spinosum]|uniref:Putative transcriptional regulatory protein n=1 Tax=Colletotrichum spinosum TaxID=1347390 RepID=A0A4R8PY28_9PEZI|nr:putative transcriptional regulatory protein [Colletotrichum spinosum]
MVRASQSRSRVACKTCHAQKLKCHGGTPCERCRERGRECVFPVKDKRLEVSSSYLQKLEEYRHLALQNDLVARTKTAMTTAAAADEGQGDIFDFAARVTSSPGGVKVPKEEILEDCSAEHFVQRLKQLSWAASSADGGTQQHAHAATDGYTYSRLKFDFLQTDVSFRLPPRPYAFHLLQVFEEGFSEYHWFLRQKFRDRLMLTYSDPQSQSHDRNWLCRVSVVLALAESFHKSREGSSIEMKLVGDKPDSPHNAQSEPSSGSTHSTPLPPGTDFFEQGLVLLKMSSEEPVPEDVEALNLIAFYCYSLNRRKAAYSYASQSVALAKLLQLHKSGLEAGSRFININSRMINEHKKRLWWTSYCMDRMISIELGVAPALPSEPEGMQLPSSDGLTPEEMEEFANPMLLTASTQLCEIKYNVVRTAAQHGDVDDASRLALLQPCINRLHEWRSCLPDAMTFEFENSLPTRLVEAPYGRILASIYLRYHQCFILLFRPLYVQNLSTIVQNRRLLPQSGSGCTGSPAAGGHDPMMTVKVQCLQAARNNCKILLGLWNYEKIAKFGYWESLHLFSGLAILSLARVLVDKNFRNSTDDTALYNKSKDLLAEMARVGNPAAKDHEALLSDVETMVNHVLEETETIQAEEKDDTAASPGQLDEFADFLLADAAGEQLWSFVTSAFVNMKFINVLALFAVAVAAAPVVDQANAGVEARGPGAEDDLVARQSWQCFACSGGKRQCCGPLGSCYTTSC